MSLVEQLAPNLVVGFVIPVRGPDLGCAISMPFRWNVCCVVRNVFFDKNTLWNDTQNKTTGGLLTLLSFRAHFLCFISVYSIRRNSTFWCYIYTYTRISETNEEHSEREGEERESERQ